MVKLPGLVTALAEVDGRERKTVEHIGRVIRERGYITTGKRGGGAANMTTREAANLIIALNGADTPKDAPAAIDRFRSLRQQWRGNASTLREKLDRIESAPQAIKDVASVHTFGEALEALIDGAPELMRSMLQYCAEAYEGLDTSKLFALGLRLGLFGLEITFRHYATRIELFTMDGSNRRVEFETEFVVDPDRLEEGFYGDVSARSDRRVVVTIGLRTLIAAWSALQGDDEALASLEEAEA
jgi:hypothetical protein